MLEATENIKNKYVEVFRKNNLELKKYPKLNLLNLVSTSKIFVIDALKEFTGSNIFCIFLDEITCTNAYRNYRNAFPESKALTININDQNSLIESISKIDLSGNLTIFTYAEALIKQYVSKNLLESQLTTINISSKGTDNINYNSLIKLLTDQNFKKVDFVYSHGEYAVRGNIIDIFSYAEKNPCRVVFQSNNIKYLKIFNPSDQLSNKDVDYFRIIPYIEDKGTDNLINFIKPSDLIVIDKPHLLNEKLQEISDKNNYINIYKLKPENAIISINHNYSQADKIINFKTNRSNIFNRNYPLLLEELNKNNSLGIENYIFAKKNQLNPQYFADILKESGTSEQDIHKNLFKFANTELSNGFIDHDLKISCYSYNEIFGKKQPTVTNKIAKPKASIKHIFDEIKQGDYISHIDHGIGKLAGIEKIVTGDKTQECLRIVYADSDLLYLNVNSLNKISKYNSKSDSEVKLSKLGSLSWDKLKTNTKNKIKDIGRELISLYAQRKIQRGYSFQPDSYLQYKMESAFQYEDTPDQEKTNIEIKRDMEATYPMDRLVCGDVGFGKTELAIRAAYKSFLNHKQVAVLVPTTLLTSQHTNTFNKRLKPFGVKIDHLNRFKKPTEIKKTLEDLENGKTNIIIGTHRLLSKDIKFQDLGLLIIDEEQKFGVSAKEKIKNIKLNVDTLTLTATPIPRTLKYSLMGARDISTLNTPPPNRQPVETKICTLASDDLKEAIKYEISRNGQTFIVHNRIKDIEKLAQYIQDIVPDARIALGHGQMDGDKLEQIIYKFINKEYDILISTTIIESGIDIANANTIIINNAHMFGLSDLHQMRGRVGRSNTRSYCYLVIPGIASLTHEAKERIFTLEELSDLGDGFKIAMRDLDIRGAGNILGAEQSGFIADMGLDTYNKILNEAIAELKQEEFKDVFKDQVGDIEYITLPKVDVEEETLIPNSYIANDQERYNIYMRVSRVQNDNDLIKLQNELIDRFGPIPESTQSLFTLIKIQNLAKFLGIEKLTLKKNRLTLRFIANKNSMFYDSAIFQNIISYTINNPDISAMSESNKGLSLSIQNIQSLSESLEILNNIKNTK